MTKKRTGQTQRPVDHSRVKEIVSVSLSREIVDFLDELSAEWGCSRSYAVERISRERQEFRK